MSRTKRMPLKDRYPSKKGADFTMTLEDFEIAFNRHLRLRNTNPRQIQKLASLLQKFMTMFGIKNPSPVTAHQFFSSDRAEKTLAVFRLHLQDYQPKRYKKNTIDTDVILLRTQFIRFYQAQFESGFLIQSLPFHLALKMLREKQQQTQEQIVEAVNKAALLKDKKLKSDIISVSLSEVFEMSLATYKRIEGGERWPNSGLELELLVEGVKGEGTGLTEKCPRFCLFESEYKAKERSAELKDYAYRDYPSKRERVALDDEYDRYQWYKSAPMEELADKGLDRSKFAHHARQSSIDATEGKIRRYVGFLTKAAVTDNSGHAVPFLKRDHLQKVNSGLGLKVEELNLFSILDLEYLKAYREFLKCRSIESNKENESLGTIKNLVETLADFSSPNGYLVQSRTKAADKKGNPPVLMNESYSRYSDLEWKKEIAQKNRVLISHLDTLNAKSPDSARLEYLADILELDRPLTVILEIIEGLEKDIRLLGPKDYKEFIKMQHELKGEFPKLNSLYMELCSAQAFFTLELITPLRFSHADSVEFVDIGVPKADDGHYRLILYREDFKNHSNGDAHPKDKHHITLKFVDLTKELNVTAIFDRYVKVARPYLMNDQVAIKAKRQDMLFPRELNRAFITELTECYSKLRFTPHCLRHICATDTIKTTFFIQHMDGFQAAAKMLFDAERTIEQTYADFGPKNYQTWRHAGIERQKALLQDNSTTSQQPATKSKGSFMKTDRAFISANLGLEDFDDDELSDYLNDCSLDKASLRRITLLVKKNRKKRRTEVA